MCGIVGAIAQRNVTPILLEGLHRLEYRGYDSAGVAVINGPLQRRRAAGKVAALEEVLAEAPLEGPIGIAHTRWATHGAPSELNAHPHFSSDRVAVVHNGIIENHEPLKQRLIEAGYAFSSDTDTEVIAHLFDLHYRAQPSPLTALRAVLAELTGAYALAILHRDQPEQIVCARSGSPLVIGKGIGEHFIASDPLALLAVTQQFLYLEEGDQAVVTREGVSVYDADGAEAARVFKRYEHGAQAADKGGFRHFMLKEIHEQPAAIAATLADKLTADGVRPDLLGPRTQELLGAIDEIHIVACGTSYHAGLVAKYWLEELAGIACQVEVASEYLYRKVAVPPNTLLLTISQSGETADTLSVLRKAKAQRQYVASLAICNVAGSSMVREAELSLLTHAGPEIGVASTKAFTTQLAALAVLCIALAEIRGYPAAELAQAVRDLRAVPEQVQEVLAKAEEIEALAARFVHRHHCLFLGRGALYPIAMEGALKLKEISYIHAEAYAAGELKHGPLALVDESMPVVTVVPQNGVLEKLKANLQEVAARGGELVSFPCETALLAERGSGAAVSVPGAASLAAPLVYTIPLQLLAYYVALEKGTDVDKPRNLAKSVTVE